MAKKQKLRRLTAAESDASVAHVPPTVKRRIINAYLERFRQLGIEAEEVFDGAGRSYLKIDAEALRRVLGEETAAALQQAAEQYPEMQPHKPPTA